MNSVPSVVIVESIFSSYERWKLVNEDNMTLLQIDSHKKRKSRALLFFLVTVPVFTSGLHQVRMARALLRCPLFPSSLR